MYVHLRDSLGIGTTDVDENGVIIDLDELGLPRGYEFLSVRSSGVRLSTLPVAVAAAVSEFISSGSLELSEFVERIVDI